jgi:hypothetical protein
MLSHLLFILCTVTPTNATTHAPDCGSLPTALVAPCERPTYVSIWINELNGSCDRDVSTSRDDAVKSARRQSRFFAKQEHVHACRELLTTDRPGYYAVARVRTNSGYRFFSTSGATSSSAARQELRDQARNAGYQDVDFQVVDQLR